MLSAGTAPGSVVATCLVSWVLWSMLKRFFLKSPLDKLSGPPSPSPLMGNIPLLFDLVHGAKYHRHILDRYGRAIRLTGGLGERILLIFDPKALHHILVKDQLFYEESSGIITRNELYLGEGLMATLGEKHKRQRKLMSPVFSIKHMRDLTPVFYEVTERLRTTLKNKVKDGSSKEIDVLNWMSRASIELIGQSYMGYSFDTLVEDHIEHPYSRGQKDFAPLVGGTFGFFVNQFILPFAAHFNYPRVKRFIVERIPMTRVQEIKQFVDTMHNTSLEIIKVKRDALRNSDPAVLKKVTMRKDIVSILINASLQAGESERMTDEEIAGQISTFIFVGMDTTSAAMCRMLHLLSIHIDVQERLRNEIRDAQPDGQLTHDQLMSLPYLDAVCRETLRLYPPATLSAVRTARKDMILPFHEPVIGSDGGNVSEVEIPNGTNIILSILGCNTDPKLWGPDAQEWNPDRWLSPLPNEIAEAHLPGIYSHLMTFLGGGRACIGFKFSELEIKVLLAVLLSTFKVEASKTKEIGWKITGVADPYVTNMDSDRPQLPIAISLID